MIDNKRILQKTEWLAKRGSRLAKNDAAPSLQLQPIFLYLLTFPNDWAYDREKSLN